MERKILGLLIFLITSLAPIYYNNYELCLTKDYNRKNLLTSDLEILLDIDGNQELAAYCDDGVNNGSS